MKEITVQVQRFAPLHGWTNRILRVDLSDMRIQVQETAPYVPDYIGARGIAARICWDDFAEPVAPYDPESPLMIFSGALTGSRSPYSGRTNVCGFSPQSWPYPWFTRSSIGGRFGGELKRAGYDAIVVTGAAETPVRLRIRDDRVSILPAGDLCREATDGAGQGHHVDHTWLGIQDSLSGHYDGGMTKPGLSTFGNPQIELYHVTRGQHRASRLRQDSTWQ